MHTKTRHMNENEKCLVMLITGEKIKITQFFYILCIYIDFAGILSIDYFSLIQRLNFIG